ncbi:MAG TPA: branched-chain amino acid ABC transporter substrate-binding protein [Magnetospirillaceae bacterium]|jgi:branched-chain amino acid transport system substrate-binding protein
MANRIRLFIARMISLAVALLCAAATIGTDTALAEDTVKVAYTSPLSGPFAQLGDTQLKEFQYIVDYLNAHGGVLGRKFELVPFDNKSQVADALITLQRATDQNIPFILQCSGSNIAAALIDGINKHNEYNPESRILYLDCGAVATELTNEKCSFWHFRFDMNSLMKSEVLVRGLPKDLTKVYLLNQDFIAGQSMQHDFKAFLAKLRPDIQVVGEELIPFGKVKDFSPYITKVKASGAQALVTGNFGPDLNLLIKAGLDAGIDLKYYTFSAQFAGGPTAIGPRGDGKVVSVMPFNENVAPKIGNADADAFTKGFRDKFHLDFSDAVTFRTSLEYIQAAAKKVGSLDPTKIAFAMEDMQLKDFLGYDTVMRKADHQVLMPYYTSTLTKGAQYDAENTGLGWVPTATVMAKDVDQPTTCNMKRPAM